MTTLTTLKQRAAFVLATGLIFVCRVAEACPGCKNAVGGNGESGNTTINAAGVGYALSIGLLLFMIASVLATLGYFAYRNCQAIARAQRAAWEAEEGGLDSGAMSAGRA